MIDLLNKFYEFLVSWGEELYEYRKSNHPKWY